MTTINIPNFEHYLIFEDGVIINSNTGNMMTPQISYPILITIPK